MRCCSREAEGAADDSVLEAAAALPCAADLVGVLAERLPACEPAIVTDLGPVLALHVGAGALAVCVELAGDD